MSSSSVPIFICDISTSLLKNDSELENESSSFTHTCANVAKVIDSANVVVSNPKFGNKTKLTATLPSGFQYAYLSQASRMQLKALKNAFDKELSKHTNPTTLKHKPAIQYNINDDNNNNQNPNSNHILNTSSTTPSTTPHEESLYPREESEHKRLKTSLSCNKLSTATTSLPEENQQQYMDQNNNNVQECELVVEEDNNNTNDNMLDHDLENSKLLTSSFYHDIEDFKNLEQHLHTEPEHVECSKWGPGGWAYLEYQFQSGDMFVKDGNVHDYDTSFIEETVITNTNILPKSLCDVRVNLRKPLEISDALKSCIPAQSCRTNYNEYISDENHQPKATMDAAEWLFNLHNDVNRRIGKENAIIRDFDDVQWRLMKSSLSQCPRERVKNIIVFKAAILTSHNEDNMYHWNMFDILSKFFAQLIEENKVQKKRNYMYRIIQMKTWNTDLFCTGVILKIPSGKTKFAVIGSFILTYFSKTDKIVFVKNYLINNCIFCPLIQTKTYSSKETAIADTKENIHTKCAGVLEHVFLVHELYFTGTKHEQINHAHLDKNDPSLKKPNYFYFDDYVRECLSQTTHEAFASKMSIVLRDNGERRSTYAHTKIFSFVMFAERLYVDDLRVTPTSYQEIEEAIFNQEWPIYNATPQQQQQQENNHHQSDSDHDNVNYDTHSLSDEGHDVRMRDIYDDDNDGQKNVFSVSGVQVIHLPNCYSFCRCHEKQKLYKIVEESVTQFINSNNVEQQQEEQNRVKEQSQEQIDDANNATTDILNKNEIPEEEKKTLLEGLKSKLDSIMSQVVFSSSSSPSSTPIFGDEGIVDDDNGIIAVGINHAKQGVNKQKVTHQIVDTLSTRNNVVVHEVDKINTFSGNDGTQIKQEMRMSSDIPHGKLRQNQETNEKIEYGRDAGGDEYVSDKKYTGLHPSGTNQNSIIDPEVHDRVSEFGDDESINIQNNDNNNNQNISLSSTPQTQAYILIEKEMQFFESKYSWCLEMKSGTKPNKYSLYLKCGLFTLKCTKPHQQVTVFEDFELTPYYSIHISEDLYLTNLIIHNSQSGRFHVVRIADVFSVMQKTITKTALEFLDQGEESAESLAKHYNLIGLSSEEITRKRNNPEGEEKASMRQISQETTLPNNNTNKTSWCDVNQRLLSQAGEILNSYIQATINKPWKEIYEKNAMNINLNK